MPCHQHDPTAFPLATRGRTTERAQHSSYATQYPLKGSWYVQDVSNLFVQPRPYTDLVSCNIGSAASAGTPTDRKRQSRSDARSMDTTSAPTATSTEHPRPLAVAGFR
jgi:hypothetical protein